MSDDPHSQDANLSRDPQLWLASSVGTSLANPSTLIIGHPGAGKTFLALRLAASGLANANQPALYLSDAGPRYTEQFTEMMGVLPSDRITRTDVAMADDIKAAPKRLSLSLIDTEYKNIDEFVDRLSRLASLMPVLRTYESVTVDCGSLSSGPIERLVLDWHRRRSDEAIPRLLVTYEERQGQEAQEAAGRLSRLFRSVIRVGSRDDGNYRTRTVETIMSRYSREARGVFPFRIQDLFGLIHVSDPPSQVVEVVEALNAELFNYLKTHPTALYRMHPRRFEELIAEILASFGWRIGLTAATRDGGYDIFAISSERGSTAPNSWLVECKRWSPERKVGLDVVRSLYGTRELNSALRGAKIMIATTSEFSADASKCESSRYDLDLQSYSDILRWIDEYHPRTDGKLHLRDKEIEVPRSRF